MRIQYTQKSSGYIALILGLITLKVFMESLMFGRGPVPGLSFLFYTMIFYTHYQEKYLGTLSIIYYERLKELIGKIHEFDSDISLDEYRDIFSYIHERASAVFEKFDLQSLLNGTLNKTLAQKRSDLYCKLGEIYESSKHTIIVCISRFKSLFNEEIPDFEMMVDDFRGLQNWFSGIYNLLKRNFFLLYGSLVKKWADFIE